MTFTRSFLGLMLGLIVSAMSLAQQEVTLKSGVVMIGQVKMDGDSIIVDVNGAELRLPFDEIATIVSSDTSSKSQPQRLLRMALERRILNETKNEGLGLLAEAYRLAPDEPSVVFWYAHSLEIAGNGTAANKVINENRDVRELLADRYAGIFEPLVARINERLAMKDLSEAMKRRIARFQKVSEVQEFLNEDHKISMCYFQLLDQSGSPLKRDEFKISCKNVRDSEVTGFEQGYFLHSYKQYRGQKTKCELILTGHEFKPKTIDISAPPYRLINHGKLVAERYQPTDAVTATILFVDNNQKPLGGAEANLSLYRGSTGNQQWTAKSNKNGVAEIKLYPDVYTVYGTLDGFVPKQSITRAKLDLATDESEPLTLTMYPAIDGKLKIGSRAQMDEGFSNATYSWIDMRNGKGNPTRDLPWLNVVQKNDRLVVAIGSQYNQYRLSNVWVRTVDPQKADNAGLNSVPPSEWNQLNRKLNAPEEPAQSRYRDNGVSAFFVERGQTYVGEVVMFNTLHDSSRKLTIQFEITFDGAQQNGD